MDGDDIEYQIVTKLVPHNFESGYFEVALGIDDERPGGVKTHERLMMMFSQLERGVVVLFVGVFASHKVSKGTQVPRLLRLLKNLRSASKIALF